MNSNYKTKLNYIKRIYFEINSSVEYVGFPSRKLNEFGFADSYGI